MNKLYNQVIDKDLLHLSSFQNLKKLALRGKKITNQGLEYLKNLNNLEELYLENTKVTAEGLADLQTVLPNCQIITEKLAPLGHLTNNILAKIAIKIGLYFLVSILIATIFTSMGFQFGSRSSGSFMPIVILFTLLAAFNFYIGGWILSKIPDTESGFFSVVLLILRLFFMY